MIYRELTIYRYYGIELLCIPGSLPLRYFSIQNNKKVPCGQKESTVLIFFPSVKKEEKLEEDEEGVQEENSNRFLTYNNIEGWPPKPADAVIIKHRGTTHLHLGRTFSSIIRKGGQMGEEHLSAINLLKFS
ncbi:hypothetical protein Avbf_10590 [Armadillidium vulgare]|nr:hypothetical protein Avbf_10590 [Armadillidium vulgare]